MKLMDAAGGLPAGLFTPVNPEPLPAPHWLAWNAPLARTLGLPETPDDALLRPLAGNATDASPASIATVYGGHQFGVWAGRLGDGRALLLGALTDLQGQRQEVQLKGAGRTPFSRGADGRAVLRSSIREYLCSEAMHGLGIPTTRALALVGSPQPVRRETIETAAVVTRVAPSFLRFGHFEWLTFREQFEALRALADHVIAQHYPQHAGAADATARWLTELIERTARLMAQWQSVGFCHGVMNTDNFSVLGLTLDYGPFGFQDGFDAGHICNHSDEGGRYPYQQQPQIGQWNCAQLLNACLPLLDPQPEAAVAQASAILDAYGPAFATESVRLWRAKLGLRDARDDDPSLINRWLTLLHRTRGDFTLSFRRLAQVRTDTDAPDEGRDHLIDPLAYDAWLADYRARLRSEQSDDAARAARLNATNPLYVLRNHLAQQAIERVALGDTTAITRLQSVLARPCVEQPGMADLAAPPLPGTAAIEVSCSS